MIARAGLGPGAGGKTGAGASPRANRSAGAAGLGATESAGAVDLKAGRSARVVNSRANGSAKAASAYSRSGSAGVAELWGEVTATRKGYNESRVTVFAEFL